MTWIAFVCGIFGAILGFMLSALLRGKKLLELTRSEVELKTLLQKEREGSIEKIQLLEAAQLRLSDAFKALSAEALQTNNQSFLTLAQSTLEKFHTSAQGDLEKRQVAIQNMVNPVRESLQSFDLKIQDLEKTRVGAYEGLTQQVRSMLETQTQLKTETSNLVRALANPQARGRWGEIQLRRVVEIAGMSAHCDFQEQVSTRGDQDSGALRPDLIVRLPAGKNIVIDAKAPMEAYLRAIETNDDKARIVELQRHARHIRTHVQDLSRKSYWEQFQPSPEFVVLFIPGEIFVNAALEQDPDLIEYALKSNVIIATPASLIAILKAVAFGWRQESLQENAQKISDLGKELYKRLSTLGGHMGDVGSSLGRAVDSYNKAVSSLESRVMVSARRFSELQASSGEADIEPLAVVDKTPQKPQVPELLGE